MKHINSPKIDYRSETELLADLSEAIVGHTTAWDSGIDTATDMTNLQSDPFAKSVMMSFLRIFQVMQERLNKVPDKHFIAFLDMLALQMRHPEPARTPISFFLSKGAKRWTVVPSGTQIASDTPEAPTPVVFETIEDIAVVLPRPVKAVSVRPSKDTHTFHASGLFNVEENTVETFFEGQDAMPHRLYLGDASLGERLPGDTVTIVLEFYTKGDVDLFMLMDHQLLYFHDELADFVPIAGVSFTNVPGFLNKLEATFTVTRTPAPFALSGSEVDRDEDFQNDFSHEAFELEDVWLAIEGVPKPNQVPFLQDGSIVIRDIQLSYVVAAENQSRKIDMAIANRTETDLSKDFFPLGQRPKFNDTFYFANEELFSKESGSLDVEFTFSSNFAAPQAGSNGQPQLIWEYHGDNGWQELTWRVQKDTDTTVSNIDNGNDTRTVTVTVVETLRELNLNQIVNQVQSETQWVETISSSTVTSHTVTVTNMLTNEVSSSVIDPPEPIPNPLPTVELVTDPEYFTSDITEGLMIGQVDSTGNSPVASSIHLPLEIVAAPVAGHEVKFAPVKVNGKENLWMRFRLSGGDYGELIPSHFKLQTNSNGQPVDSTGAVTSDPAQFVYMLDQNPQEPQPPCIDEILISYTPPGGDISPASTVSYNNYYYRDLSGLISTGIRPFIFNSDKTPSLYIGFDAPLAELPMTLFFSLLKQDKMSELFLLSSEPPKVFWEYWDNGWKTLQVDDRTEELRSRDIVKFRAPETLDKSLLFSEELYWIRARLEREEPSLIIKGDGLYNNVAWAHQYVTIDEELLGSGSGLSSQKLTFKNKPVLPGERVYILDEIISDEEKDKYLKLYGQDAVVEKYNTFTQKIETWVQWFPVDHFYFSNKDSRHYYIDRIKGEITFGDNHFGMIPPKAKNNIKCLHYRYGGGEHGNLNFGTVKKLRTSIPYVDACINFLPSFGGEKEDTVSTLVSNAPDMLKSGNRAITAEDFIFMVKQASGQVSRVKCLPTTDISGTFRPGYITLMVLPFSDSEKPVLDAEIIDDIEKYLAERMVFNLTESSPKQVNLVSPKYIQCSVDVLIAEYTDINLSLAAENEIQAALAKYFHANHGGPGGTGWPFGRNVPVSELIQIAEKVEAVSLVSDISISISAHQMQFTLNTPQACGITFPKHSLVELQVPPGGDLPCKFRYYLPEAIPQGEIINGIVVMGFKEGDRIQVETTYGNELVTSEILLVSGIGFDYLEIESVYLPFPLERGAAVRTVDGRVESYLLEAIPLGRTTRLRVAVPEKPDSRIFLFPGGDLTLIHSRNKNVQQKFSCNEISREISTRTEVLPMQQFSLVLDSTTSKDDTVQIDFKKNSIVDITISGVPHQLRYYLLEDIDVAENPDRFVAVGFQERDEIELYNDDLAEVIATATVDKAGWDFLDVTFTSVSPNLASLLTNAEAPFGTIVQTVGAKVKSYLLGAILQSDIVAGGTYRFEVACPRKPDISGTFFTSGAITMTQYNDDSITNDYDYNNTGVRISTREEPMKVVYLEDNYLTYSGKHTVEQEGV